MGKEVFNGVKLSEATECVAELARFFPGIVPLRIPVLILKGDPARAAAEQTTIEFGTAEECLFVCGLPLEFEDLEYRGVIEPMPPDKFRRESEQKIPIPNIIQPKGDESHSMGKSLRGRGKVREV